MTSTGVRPKLPVVLRYGLPLAVSGGILAWMLSRIDIGTALSGVDLETGLQLGAALALYLAVSLGLEALSLARAARGAGAHAPLTDWARAKAASYPLQMLHYALGMGGLTLLLRRRLGLSVTGALGVVMLVSFFDLGALLALGSIGAALAPGAGFGVRAGIAVAVLGGLVVGLFMLRMPGSLGPLDRIRDAAALRAAREAPLRALLELAVLRLAMVGSFIAFVGAALVAFGVTVPLGIVLVGVVGVALVASVPIAVSGLGTSQFAFVAIFGPYGSDEVLLACSLSLSAALLLTRVGLGLVFAGEFTREAFQGTRA